MKNNRIEKEIDIEVVASILEKIALGGIYNLTNFASMLIDESVDSINLVGKLPEIEAELNRQYPNIKRLIGPIHGELHEGYTDFIVEQYRKTYGDKITFLVYPKKEKKLKPFHFKY